MKITNLEAWSCVQMISGVKETGKLGFAIAKNARKLKDELKEYDAKRDELIEKYGTALGDGRFNLTSENASMLQEEMAEYDSIEFEFEPLKVSEEVFCGGNLTSDQMYMLMWMVDEQ